MTHTPLDDRYGRSRPQAPASGHRVRRRTVIITVVVLIACVGLVAIASFRPKSAPQTPTDVAYREIDATRISVTISAVPDATRSTRCAVQAVSIEEAVVGYKEVDFPPQADADRSDPIHKRVVLNTTQQAVSGQLDKCWFVVD